MSSWAVLLALSGFQYSGVEHQLTLVPRVRSSNFRSIWSIPSGWGSYSRRIRTQLQEVILEVSEGEISLARMLLVQKTPVKAAKVNVQLGSESIAASVGGDASRSEFDFGRVVQVTPGHPLRVSLITS